MGFEIVNGVLKKYKEEPGVTEVVIPDSVTSIGYGAFANCTNLTSVTIPDSVTRIGNSAFNYCKSLTSITIPDSVTSIGYEAFEYCTSLTSVTIGKGLTSIDNIPCSDLEEIIVSPDNMHLMSIDNVVYDKSGTKLIRCSGKKKGEFTIPDSVTSIGNDAFYKCKSLTSITIPDSVTSIGNDAFYKCKSLTSITIPDSVTSIGNDAFYKCKSLTSITIPDSVTSIGNDAFYKCKSLTSITIPDSVTSIGNDAFYKCKSLTSITIPDSVTSIGNDAFYKCKSLTSITIPDSVTSIGNDAFYKCKSLTSITIPDSVTSIGNSAFGYCKSLTSVTIGKGLTSIDNIPCSDLEEIIVSPDNMHLMSIDNVVYDKSGTKLIRCSGKKKGEFTIPDSVTNIERGTFSGCSSLTTVTIGNGVTSIGEDAFWQCISLTSVTIPDSVTSIENGAFNGCESLTSVTIPDSVTSIGGRAFYECKRLTAVTIGNGVTSIGEDAFRQCISLTDVTIGKSLHLVGKDAFEFCDRIKAIRFSGGPSKIPGNIPVNKIRVSDAEIKSGEKIDPKLIKNIKTKDIELISYLLVYQTAKAWKQHIFDHIKNKDRQAVYDLIPARLREMDKVSSASAAQVLEFTRSFINDLSSESVRELYAVFTEKKCKKQLKEMDDDANIQGKMNSADGTFVVKKPFYESFIDNNKIKTTAQEIKNLGITLKDIPDLYDKDGQMIPKEITAWLLTVHGTEFDEYDFFLINGYEKPGVCSKAQKIISRVAPEALQKFLDAFVEYLVFSVVSGSKRKRMFLAFPICRYADEKTMESLTKQAPRWSNTPLYAFRQAYLYSNTRSAMLFAERYHELDVYAGLRGMDEDTFRDMYLSDIGLDTQGGKKYDLGNQTVTARLQKDLSFIFELPDGKTAKSLPKKGADTGKYEAAKKDFDEMKKAAKKILKSRGNVLFDDFLSGKARKAQEWNEAYLNNPLLRNIAKIVVWSQGNSTFVLTDSGAIDCSGQKYTITDEEIKTAHPMEMDKADVTAWQKYFADNNLKQPFAQVWEPVRDPAQIKEDRYKGCRLEVYQFSGKDKHGIHAYGVHAYSDDFGFELDDCKLGYACDTARLIEIKGVYYTLGKFSFKKFTRKVNHIITILDKMTIADKVLKDDVSVVEQMDSFTVAQIIEFISIATEAKAINVTAELLQYRHDRFPDYDPLAEFDFTLDL